MIPTEHDDYDAYARFEDESRGRTLAIAGAVAGITAMALDMVGPCLCYVPYVLGFVLGAVAVGMFFMSRMGATAPDVSALGWVSLATGLLSALWSLVIGTLICLYFALYAVLIASVINSGP